MAVIVLSKPGPPLPLVKGIVGALVLAGLVAAGVVMVPLLENYAVAGILLTTVILFAIFFAGLVSGSPLTMVLVIAFAMMPVAGSSSRHWSARWPSLWQSVSQSARWSALFRAPFFRTGQPRPRLPSRRAPVAPPPHGLPCARH